MTITHPVTPGDERIVFDQYEFDKMINKINQDITTRNWHNQHFPLKDDGGEWNAIVINIDVNKTLMNEVVKVFQSVGWDCKFQNAYDGRGPHQCFYVNKKHFT